MKLHMITAGVLAAGLLVAGVAFAAELGAPNQGAPNVVFKSWDPATRTLTLESGLIVPKTPFTCIVAPNLGVPATIAPGRAIYVTYTGPGLGQPGEPPLPGNTCSQISFQ
jgi:hypothetical protein